MAASPVNLKERIAALQQRNMSPNTHQSAQAVPRGFPSPSAGGLRDKIAKFEEKGGMPVPRGSFAMGVPQLAENAPPKKRGELYGNRVPGLGRPSGVPVSRPESPLPSTDESPCPRKRCISTGTGLSGTPSNFATDEPVPALPNGLSGLAPRRNSLAVHFGPGRRVMSTNDADDRAMDFADASSPPPSSLMHEKPSGSTEEHSPSLESASLAGQFSAVATPLAVEEPQLSSLEAPEDTPETLEPPPVEEVPFLADSGTSTADTPAEDPPAPQHHPFSLYDPSQIVSQFSTVEQGSKDGLSDDESAHSAVSRPSPSLPKPASPAPSSIPADTLSATPTEPTHAPTEIVVVSRPTSPPENAIAASSGRTITISVPNPMVPIPPSISTPTSVTASEAHWQSKPTFKAVVHRKVTEPPIDRAPFVTPQRRGVSGIKVIEMPPSPGFGDLAVLLEDAALLESKLTEKDGTALKAKEHIPTTPTPTSATFPTAPRHAPASTLSERAPVPFIDSGSQSVRSVSIPCIREPLVDGEEDTDGRSLASTTFSQRSLSHRKYLSNIYRLTGRRSSSYVAGAYPRDSMSMSSEDSSPVTTPSDNGKRKGFGIAWPTPKKGGSNASRSSSFADKIFNRNRTKSNVSTADQVSGRNSIYEPSQPNLAISFTSELSPEGHPDGVEISVRPASWVSPGDSNSEFSPTSSLLDKDIFDAFPSVPQTLPPGFYLDVDNGGIERASTLPVKGRKQVNQRLSMV